MAGYTSQTLAFFDHGQGSLVNAFKLGDAGSQVNKVISHPVKNLIFAGLENGTLDCFDFNANQVVKTIPNAHADSISSIAISSSGMEILTASHDKSIKVWDLRTQK